MLRKPLRLRNNETGFVRIVTVILVLIIAGMVAASLYSGATDPGRLMNPDVSPEDTVAYYRTTGYYEVSAFLEFNAGSLIQVNVRETKGPTSTIFGSPLIFGLFESHGYAFVRVTVTGPGGVLISNWESEHTQMNFYSADVFIGGSKGGSFTSGTAAFPEHGSTTWVFQLVWHETHPGNVQGDFVLDTQTQTIEV